MGKDGVTILHPGDASNPNSDGVPQHIAVIMDGNGRWAQRNGLPRVAGHRRGVDAVKQLVRGCGQRGVPYLTLFAFSSENWKRPKSEVKLLIELLTSTLENEVRKLDQSNVRLRIIGDLRQFSSRIRLLVRNAEELTSKNTALNLTVAVNYGGRWDIAEACRIIAHRVARGELNANDIGADIVAQHLSTHFLPEPDLFIRTGGEQRISNFLLWQLAYTEFYFIDVLWPDFSDHDLANAVKSFAGRQRRFGRTSDQVSAARRAQNA